MSSDCFSYCQIIDCLLLSQWKNPWSRLLVAVKFVFLNPFSSFVVHFKTFAMQKDDDVASDYQAQFVMFNVHSVQNVAVSTFCVVVVCKIHRNKGIETSV